MSPDSPPPPVPHHTLTHSNIQRDQGIIEHPNGSDGWLPAEGFNLQQVPTTRRSTNATSPAVTKRKSAFRGHSISRYATTAAAPRPTESAIPSAPAPLTEEELQDRAASANNNLTPKQRSRIAKSEVKDGRRISKIIKEEGRAEEKVLEFAINELQKLQKLQSGVFKSEARAQANHAKSLVAFKRTEAAFLNAKMRYDTAMAELNAEVNALEVLKNNASQARDQLQEKTADVENLRTALAVDKREREIKLSDLKGSTVNGTTTKTWR